MSTSADSEKKTLPPRNDPNHFSLTNLIEEKVRDIKILFNLLLGEETKVGKYNFDKNWNLIPMSLNQRDTKAKDAVGVTGNILEMTVTNLKKELFAAIDVEQWLSEEATQQYKESIDSFIEKDLVTPYRSLKNANTMKGTIYKHFHTLRKQKKITLNERNISISIAQMLHKKNPNFILSSGEVSLEGRIYLHHICNKALEKPSSSGSKSISSILHDGDYSWTYTPLTELKRVPLLEHFVQFVHYLMDGDCFNPYDKYSDETGKDKRQRAKNGYINDIYIFSQANATIPKSSPTPPTPDYTDIMHKNTVELYKESKIVLEVNAGNKDKKGRWEFSYRKKTDESKLKKVGKNWWYTPSDDSWLRLTRFGDIEGDDVKKMILENIKTFIKKYLEIKQQQGNSIKKLQIDRKGKMIPLEYCEQILKSAKAIYPTASKRRSSSETSDKTLADYETFYDETLSPEVKNAYTIAKGIQRGGNGAYTDCKCIFQSENEHWEQENEEFSLYHRENEVGLAHTIFYNCQKDIFESIYKRKSSSLNKLRYKWETAIKKRSYELDFEEIDHKNGIYPAPNDKYKYFETEIWAAPKRNLETQEQAKIGANENWTQESISLKNLQYRNKENDKNFDKLICHAINSGLKENKMMFLHPSDTGGRNSFITPDIIKDKEMAGDIRFISSEILEELALNPKYNRTYSVEIYDDQRQEFYMVPLGELGKLIDGIEKSKSISPSTTP